MVEYIVIGVAFLLLAVFSVTMIYRNLRRPSPESLPEPEPLVKAFERRPIPVMELRELGKLNNWGFFENIQAQMYMMKISERNPEFYAKYQELFEIHMDSYFQRLMGVLGRNDPKLYDIVVTRYESLSTQEMLLVMLMDTELLNREMADMLYIPLETLKKRKLRLKAKLEKMGGVPSTVEK